jgi:DNA-binding response OmpR family regulator
MRILVYDQSQKVREGFIISLIPRGFEVVTIKDKKEIMGMFFRRPFDVAVLEVSIDDEEMLSLIETLHTEKRYSNTKIIVHTIDTAKNFIVELIKFNVSGYLLKPFNEKDLFNRLTNLLEKANCDMSKNTVCTVTPSPDEGISVKFRSTETHKVLTSNVLEISAVGVKFSISDDFKDEINVKQFINNFQIQIGSSRIVTPALVTLKKDDICQVVYYNMPVFDLNTVCKYVYEQNLKKLLS